jgi:hypothetical protein
MEGVVFRYFRRRVRIAAAAAFGQSILAAMVELKS